MYFKLSVVIICLQFFGANYGQNCSTGLEYRTCSYNQSCKDLMYNVITDSKPCIDGCFCPYGQVLNTTSNKCVPAENCCTGGEVYSQCGGRCQGSCSVPNRICSFICISGCVCPQGQLRNESGVCVWPRKCVCPPGEVYTYGNRCPPTCFFPNQSCESFVPVHGCFCLEGTIRNDFTHKCVPPEDCPTCPKDQEPSHSGNSCRPSCYNPKPKCTGECQPGCVCSGGKLMDTNSGQCVKINECSPTEDCPKGTVRNENTGECECPSGKHHEYCGTACPSTCIKPSPQICTDQCVNGCFCNKGTILDTQTNECVPPEKCTCPNNMVYGDCGSACPDTCQYQNQSCTKDCVKGCFCPKGTVQDLGTNLCLPRKKCICSNDKIFQCGSTCPPTCTFPNQTCVNKKCELNCFCRNGTILDETTGNCVTPNNCPK